MQPRALSTHSHTPKLTVVESRGLTVRSVDYYRASPGDRAEARVNRTAHDPAGWAIAQWDPRLFLAALAPANLSSIHSLSGAVLASTSVDAGLRVSLFGEAGQPVYSWDGRGSQRWMHYDDQLRLNAMFEQAVEGEAVCTERLSYAASDQAFAIHNQCGRLIRHDDPAGALLFNDYGLTGAVLEQERLLANERTAGYATLSRVNPLSELLSRTDAKGNEQRFSQTLDGLLHAVDLRLNNTVEHLPMVNAIACNAHGQVEKEVAGNGVVTTLEYAAEDGRLKRLLSRLGQNDPLQDLRYLYDPVGNVLSIEDAALPIRYFANQRIEPVSHYRYDTLYRLIEATGWEAGAVKQGPSSAVTADPSMPGNYRQTYRYDDGNNLLELTHVGPQNPGHRLVAAAHSNRCLPVCDGIEPDEVDFLDGFDANGNLLKLQPGQPLIWDVRNQLCEVRPVERDSAPDDRELYYYGADGMRVRKVRSLQTNAQTVVAQTLYLPGLEIRTHNGTGEELHVIEVATGRGNVRVLHWEKQRPTDITNNQQRYSLTDDLGSSMLELDQDAKIITQERYYPFGGTAWSNGEAVQVNYKAVRYSGKELDATGLYYYGFRYYVPWLQRWLNPDPAENIDGVNRFRAMQNNLLRYRDVDGLVSTDDASETMAGSMHTNSFPPSIFLPSAVGSVPNVQKIGRNTFPVEQQNSTFEVENPLSRGGARSVQERSSLKSKVKGISIEAQGNLLVMEKNRQFVGVMSVKSHRVDIAISSQLGVPGSDVERPMPRGVTYKIGPVSPNFSFALDALHSVGKRADGSELDFTGHSMMVKMLSGEEKNYIGFSGVKRSDGVIRLKWTSRTLNPEHASFISKYHLGNPGVEQRDYVLSKKYQDIVVKRFERSGYTVIKD